MRIHGTSPTGTVSSQDPLSPEPRVDRYCTDCDIRYVHTRVSYTSIFLSGGLGARKQVQTEIVHTADEQYANLYLEFKVISTLALNICTYVARCNEMTLKKCLLCLLKKID